MDLQMGGNAAEVQQGVRRGVGAKAELDDGTETAVTHDLQAVVPHYQRAQRYLRRSHTRSRFTLKLTLLDCGGEAYEKRQRRPPTRDIWCIWLHPGA